MKYKKIISSMTLSAILFSNTQTVVFAANQIVPLENVIENFLWFDNESDIREIATTQTHNQETVNGITTYYNTYGDAIMKRSGESLTINLETDESGDLTRWAKATIYQGADGEQFSSVKIYKVINGQEKITKNISPTQDVFYTYDENGNRTSFVQAIKDGNGNVTKYYEGAYTFDENGNQVSSISTSKDANGNITGTYENVDTYDENGNKTSGLSTSKDANGNITGTYENVDTYDENGNRLTYSTTSKDANGDTIHHYEGSFTYDENGNKILQTSPNRDLNGNLKWTSEHTYTYDDNGNQTSEISSTIHPSGTTYSHGKEFTFDENGNKTSSLIYNKSGNTINSSWEDDYSYDDNGNLISTNATGKDSNGDITYTAQYNSTFDENGNKTSYIETSQDANGDPRNSREQNYTYNENGELITNIDIRRDANGNQTSRYDWDYSYNDSGNETGVIISLKDENGDTTMSYERTYILDENGEPISDLDTEKDANGNVISVSKKKHYNFLYDESITFSDGEVSSASVNSSIEYTTYEDDGSYSATTISAVNEGSTTATVDSTWLKDFSSSIDSLNTENYTPSGDYLGYKKTDLNYDENGNLIGSTKLNYTGASGSENYNGKTEYGNYTYNDDGQVSGYTKTAYDLNDVITETTVYTNTQYDSYGRKSQASFSTTDGSGTVTNSGTKTY